MQTKEYRMLKKMCILFGILILLFNSTSWGINRLALKIVETMFFIYLIHWLDKDKIRREKVKLIFFVLFLVGIGFGSLFNNIILRLFIAMVTVFAAMLYLYSIKISISFDKKFLINFLADAVYLPFAYIDDFFTKEQCTRYERIKRQKLVNGMIISSIIAFLILIPLYMNGDDIFKGWMEIGIGWLVNNLFSFMIAIIFCWIPAMLIFSYVKGLNELKIGNRIPENILSSIDKKKMFFNLFSVRLILIVSTIVNALFAMSQICYFFYSDKNYDEINGWNHMVSIFIAVIFNELLLLFLTLIIKEKKINTYSDTISSFNVYYAISILMVWVALVWRYVTTVFRYGLKGIWPIWGLGMLLMVAIISWNVKGILWDYKKFIKISCYGTAALLIIFSICIPEFWIGKINVKIFDYKYHNNLLVNAAEDVTKVIIEPQDLDIEYLETLDKWAIPALLDIKDIPNYYAESGKTINNIVDEEIVTILEKDLTIQEKELLKGLAQNEKRERLVNILEKKIEYRLPGKKKTILNMVKQISGST